jgi:hypothetical protein
MRILILILGAVLAVGAYAGYALDAATSERLGDAVHNLWHPDYPAGFPPVGFL